MEPLYRSIVVAGKTMIKAMGWRMLVTGAERIPKSGPAVLASNHVSYLDPIIVGYAADQRGRAVRFLGKQELFDHWLTGPLLRRVGQIPVDRGGNARRSIERAVTALRRGELVGMFPEATISTSFVPASGKLGAAAMAMRARAPLIPAAVWGGQRVLTKLRPRNLQRGVAMVFRAGPPVHYEPDEDPTEVTKRLMEAITELVDQAAATYPDKPAGDEDRWWLPRHLGGTAPSVEEAEELRRREAAARRARRRQRRQERQQD